MKQSSIVLMAMMVMSFLFTACTSQPSTNEGYPGIKELQNRERPVSQTGNGIYYWKTIFNLSDSESSFLKEHKIEKLYLRLFDVDYGEDYDGKQKAIPIATLRFNTAIPADIEVVPVVYITQSAIKKDDKFAKILYDRILAMGRGNGFFKRIWEIQLDCDWSAGTEEPFFHLCEELASYAHKDKIDISATIRLHQLKKNVPPVDKGVLMLYNTGSLYQKETQNSILSYQDVVPYIKHPVSYTKPLSLAFPIYGWGILMRDNRFTAILHHTDFSDGVRYQINKDGYIQVKKAHYLDNVELMEGDLIRLESSSYDEIMKVKEKVKGCLQNESKGNIIYHLDSLGLSKFSTSELTNILK